jgi:hypothetical protein
LPGQKRRGLKAAVEEATTGHPCTGVRVSRVMLPLLCSPAAPIPRRQSFLARTNRMLSDPPSVRLAGTSPYRTLVLRRCIRIKSTMTKSTPATTRMIVVLSTSIPPFSQWVRYCLNDSDMMMTAGPKVTRKREGKIKKTSGKTSLTEVFAACSSTCWRRWVLRTSE